MSVKCIWIVVILNFEKDNINGYLRDKYKKRGEVKRWKLYR